MKTDRVRGHLDLLVLSVLSAGPAHGYAVIEALRTTSEGVLDLPEGSVYPALHRLEDLGLVASEWRPVAGRRRREYELTDKGSRALVSERAEWRRLSGAVSAVLALGPRGTATREALA